MDETREPLLSERLNAGCFCLSLNEVLLHEALSTELGSTEILKLVEERCPYLFSARPVFISESQKTQMADVVRAIESVIALPSYRQHVLADAPAIARHDPGGAKGVFFGYDFHIAEDTIGLIEVNTNAGGAMLNAVLARAHHSCCLDEAALFAARDSASKFEASIVEMFRDEWRLSNRRAPLKTIAIVDADPFKQYLYPEFLLFQRLFERAGIVAVIADPGDLLFKDGMLWHHGVSIDLVYNRLTDFMLETDASAHLRAAYLANAVVLTPHPQSHALYADKRNLALLSDAKELNALGVPVDIRDTLTSVIPQTEVVDVAHADRLWDNRRRLFFKPTAGYGGRAAYRGDKITKRVWQEILAGHYVAQAFVAPGERISGSRAMPERLKFDIRCYTYAGDVQWTAARLYQGQTTNFRTSGGGFAPVYGLSHEQIDCSSGACGVGDESARQSSRRT